MWAVYRKELRYYFFSPLAWVLWTSYSLCMALGFNYVFNRYTEMSFNSPDTSLTEALSGGLYGFARFLALMLLPMLTMRIFAEEKQTGTLELLFTYPLTEAQMLLGKLLAVATISLVMTLLPLPQVLYLSHSATVEWQVLFTCFAGIFLLMLALLSFGVFVSAISPSQVVALVITYGALLLLWLAGVFGTLFSAMLSPADVPWYYKPLAAVAWVFSKAYKELSLTDHGESFSHGLINTNDVLFFITFTLFFCYLAVKKLESRKWRG